MIGEYACTVSVQMLPLADGSCAETEITSGPNCAK